MQSKLKKIDVNFIAKYLKIDSITTYEMNLDITGNSNTPEVPILFPQSTKEVANILSFCNEYKIPIVTIGGATNLNGGTVPDSAGIALSLKKMDRINYIDSFNRTAQVECGCNTMKFIQEVERNGLLFPQNIASADRSTIGGNLAVSSGSPRSLFYGTTKNYALNLEIVLSDGQIINTAYNVTKLATGFNLTQLMIGSEGTLGVITKATFKLIVPKKYRIVSQFTFETESDLFETFKVLFVKGFDPISVEFMDSQGVEFVKSYLNDSGMISQSKGGILWMEWEANTAEELALLEVDICKVFEGFIYDINFARSKDELAEIWKYRQSIGYAVKEVSSFTDVDVVVPRSKVQELYQSVKNICMGENVRFTSFAHIGDGNLHINILRDSLSDSEWNGRIDNIFKKIYQKAIDLGGAISGEHGVGVYQQRHLKGFFPAKNLELNQSIKDIFDPNGILNPGVMFKKTINSIKL